MQKVLCRLRWLTSAHVVGGARKPHLRIHVGAVEIDLPAMAMHDVADLADMFLEHAVGRGIW